MRKKHNIREKVKSIEIKIPKTISELLNEMGNTGFQGRKLSEACEIYKEMIEAEDLTIIMGYSGSLSVAGQWRIISWLIEHRFIDILVSTGANISEDIVEAMGYSYYKGSDIVDDENLFKLGLNRYYDIYGKESDYLKMTELIAEFISTLDQTFKYSSREFLYLFGIWLRDKGIRSIVTVAAENKIPIYCPAIADSPYGDAALIADSNGFELTIDSIKDYKEFMSLAGKVSETGVFYIGGGVPKDFIQLFAVTADLLFEDRKIPNRKNTFDRQGINETYYPHKYAIQITTDSPQWGGLSGCTFKEAISWGKETYNGKFVQCYCDASIALPILIHSIAEKNMNSRDGTNFSFLFR